MLHIARKFMDAYSAQNIKSMSGLFAKDAVIEFMGGKPLGRKITGNENIDKFFMKRKEVIKSKINDVSYKIINHVESDDFVAIESVVTASTKVGAIDSKVADIFEIQNNKITKLTVYVTSPAETRIGLLSLRNDLSIKDMGELSVAVWAIA